MRVILPSPLYSYTGGRAEVDAAGATLAALAADLNARYPGIRFRMIDEQGRIRPHILIFVNGTIATAMSEPLEPASEVHIVASLSGG